MFCQSMIVLACAWVVAQQTPTPSFTTEVQAYQQERTESTKHFAAAALRSADRLIERAQLVKAQGDDAFAQKLVRNARWHLPYVPVGLPEHIEKVLGQARLRHDDRVNAISFRPDGRRVVTASRDGTARVWNLDNGREVVIYKEHLADASDKEESNVFQVPMVTYSPDGKTIASSGSRDIHLWDAETGQRLKTLTGHDRSCRGLAFSPNGKRLISGSDDRSIIIWDVATGKKLVQFPNQEQRIEAIAINPSGESFASLNVGGLLQIFPLEDKANEPIVKFSVVVQALAPVFILTYLNEHQLLFSNDTNKITLQEVPKGKDDTVKTKALRLFSGHTKKVNAIATIPGGKRFITGSDDTTVRVWNVETGETERIFNTSQDIVTALAVAPDGSFALCGSEDGQMQILPLSNIDDARFNDDAQAELWSVAVSPAETLYAAAGADRSIRVYDVKTGTLKQTLSGHTAAVTALTFLDEGRLASTSGDKLLKIWDLATGKAIDCSGHTSAVLAVATTPDGKTLVTGGFDRTLRGWNPETGKQLWTWKGDSAICTLALSQDGRTAFVGCADGQLIVVDLANPDKPLAELAVNAHRNGVAEIALAPDGNRLATCGGDGLVVVWNRRLKALDKVNSTAPMLGEAATPKPLTTVDYSPNGKYLMFAGADGRLSVWDAITLYEVRTFQQQENWITSARFGPITDDLYVVGTDKKLRRYNLSFETARSIMGHSMAVQGLAVSPDQKRLATASADRSIKIWDIETGQVVQTLVGSQDEVRVVRYLDNRTLASNAQDSQLRIWSLDTGEMLRATETGESFVMGSTLDGKQVSVIYNIMTQKTVFIDTFQTADLKREQITEKDRSIVCGNFSHDMSLAVTGDSAGIIRIWDVAQKKQVGGDWALFDQNSGDVAITPDNKTIIGMDSNGSIKIANIAERSAQEAFPALPNNQQPEIAGIAISPDGKRFCTFFLSGEVVLWTIDGKKLRDWKLLSKPQSLAFIPETNRLAIGNKDGTVTILTTPADNDAPQEK